MPLPIKPPHEHCWHNIPSSSAESGERIICCICTEEK